MVAFCEGLHMECLGGDEAGRRCMYVWGRWAGTLTPHASNAGAALAGPPHHCSAGREPSKNSSRSMMRWARVGMLGSTAITVSPLCGSECAGVTCGRGGGKRRRGGAGVAPVS